MRSQRGAVAAIALTLAACAPRASEPPAAPVVDLAAEERAAYEATIERMEAELAAAVDARAQAEEALGDARLGIDVTADGTALAGRLEYELEACQGELARYREGLGRAVEELNERPAAIRLPPPRQAPARDYGRVHIYTPRVRVQMLAVLVEWTFYSTRDTPTEGTAVVRLMEDGREVEVERQPVRVDANARFESSVLFQLTPNPTGVYTAQVSLEEI